MISRIWYGWTTPQNADAYENLLKTEIFPGILARNLAGFRRIELLRRSAGEEVEFVTVMWFCSMEAVRAFAGAQWEVAVVPEAARAVLKRFDPLLQHYEVREAREEVSPSS
jgi:heme-degrading monooxygenase HmoA